MRKNAVVRRAVAASLGVVSLAHAPSARAAAVPCSSFPNPVYVTGASVAKPLVQALAKAIAPLNISIIYQNPDSCLGVQDLLLNQPSSESGVSTQYLGTNGTSTTACVLDTSDPQTPDVAVSEVYASTCGYGPDSGTNGTVDILGPINAMVFAVPGGTSGSAAASISAEAAYVVFGWDATSPYVVQPWNQPSDIFVREQTSGSQAMMGVALGLPSGKWQNAATNSASPQQQTTSTKMQTALSSVTTNQTAAIGVLGAENVYGYNAGSPSVPLNILAYQHTGQECGYYPGSGPKTLDELNVRQGRYAIWGSMHIIAHVDGSGNPTSFNTPSDASAVAAVLNYFIATGESPDTTPLYSIGSLGAGGGVDAGVIGADGGATLSTADKQAFIAAEATPGFVVPWCAMEVLRTSEMGPEASYQSPEPCSCFYEETLQGAPVSGHRCTSCGSDGDCSATSTTPKCRYGFCEVQ